MQWRCTKHTCYFGETPPQETWWLHVHLDYISSIHLALEQLCKIKYVLLDWETDHENQEQNSQAVHQKGYSRHCKCRGGSVEGIFLNQEGGMATAIRKHKKAEEVNVRTLNRNNHDELSAFGQRSN